MTDDERDELLIRVDERVCLIMKELVPGLSKRLANHIKHHWMISIPVGLVLLSLLVKFLV
jgi:hypothetical protein